VTKVLPGVASKSKKNDSRALQDSIVRPAQQRSDKRLLPRRGRRGPPAGARGEAARRITCVGRPGERYEAAPGVRSILSCTQISSGMRRSSREGPRGIRAKRGWVRARGLLPLRVHRRAPDLEHAAEKGHDVRSSR